MEFDRDMMRMTEATFALGMCHDIFSSIEHFGEWDRRVDALKADLDAIYTEMTVYMESLVSDAEE